MTLCLNRDDWSVVGSGSHENGLEVRISTLPSWDNVNFLFSGFNFRFS